LNLEKERELESLVTKNPDQIEEGLVFLDHQLKAASKFIDVLCADQNGILVVLELKIGEDEGILTQALEYYDYVASNKDRLASMYHSKRVSTKKKSLGSFRASSSQIGFACRKIR
jgi:RecB family endonuclease NucS